MMGVGIQCSDEHRNNPLRNRDENVLVILLQKIQHRVKNRILRLGGANLKTSYEVAELGPDRFSTRCCWRYCNDGVLGEEENAAFDENVEVSGVVVELSRDRVDVVLSLELPVRRGRRVAERAQRERVGECSDKTLKKVHGERIGGVGCCSQA